jgi:hypothetical protein
MSFTDVFFLHFINLLIIAINTDLFKVYENSREATYFMMPSYTFFFLLRLIFKSSDVVGICIIAVDNTRYSLVIRVNLDRGPNG